MPEISININSQETKYPIFIDNEPIDNLYKKLLDIVADKNYFVVISEKVEKIYGKNLKFPKNRKFILKDGEKEKVFNNLKKILDFALKLKLDRKSVIVAVGGGVIGDIAGFAASVYMRGIDFIQVPTTLLACVDSSVGGKTAVNTNFGKNLIGTFYQPKSVFINPNFLKTLDNTQFWSGLGEVIKYSFIEKSCKCDEELNLFNFMNENFQKILNRDEKILSKLIEICIKLKKSVVEKDEKERDLRRILNFGHTYGHAIEKINNYKNYTHGEAVIKGIRFAFYIALKRNLIDKNYYFLALDLIKKFDFRQIPEYKLSKMVELMAMDKKSFGEHLTFVLPTDYSTVNMFEFTKEELRGIEWKNII